MSEQLDQFRAERANLVGRRDHITHERERLNADDRELSERLGFLAVAINTLERQEAADAPPPEPPPAEAPTAPADASREHVAAEMARSETAHGPNGGCE